ncbi:hypothetical protein RIF29_13962 [Crotalaria pallida]|uniref:TraB domain-containing protein n=1 Tax=Crotalaria pallida TaxID=3830 RepID=A0AAN9IDC8_CROPI
MKREGRQHGMVRSYQILPHPFNPKPGTRFVTRFDSPPIAGPFVKVPTKPTNHSKFTSKCTTQRCADCHLCPPCKSKCKTKGTQRYKYDRVMDQPDSKFSGLSATFMLDHIFNVYVEGESADDQVDYDMDYSNDDRYESFAANSFSARPSHTVGADSVIQTMLLRPEHSRKDSGSRDSPHDRLNQEAALAAAIVDSIHKMQETMDARHDLLTATVNELRDRMGSLSMGPHSPDPPFSAVHPVQQLTNTGSFSSEHRSQKSCEEVRALINLLRPKIVFLELCRSRLSCLEEDQKIPTVKETVTAAWKNRSKINMLGQFLSFSQALGNTALKVSPVSEFRVAYDEAIKHGGIVAFGDRPIEITIMRARRKMPLREIASHFTMFWIFRQNARLLYEVIRKLLEGRDIEFGMMKSNIFRQEYDKTIPTFTEALVHERDLFMSHNLLQVAKKSCCVVAVVGKAHLPGIKKHWKQPVSLEDLLTIPPHPKTATSTIILTFGIIMVGYSTIIAIILAYILVKVGLIKLEVLNDMREKEIELAENSERK